jgi:hypothetical protein
MKINVTVGSAPGLILGGCHRDYRRQTSGRDLATKMQNVA